MNILLTGFTGNLGPELARQLAPHRIIALIRKVEEAPQVTGVEVVCGSLEELPGSLATSVEAIVHSAASTAFRAPLEDLRRVNVEGTARLLEFARVCPRLRRFVHLSTTCVCGDRTGEIPEAPLPERPLFVNAYEQSKWEAEQLVLASRLPVEIARLSIVAGSERDGSVRRIGALHHTLYWLFKGLIPMMPGHSDSLVDVISTEYAAAGVAALFRGNPEEGRVIHMAAGERAPRLSMLLDWLAELCQRQDRGWASGAVTRPDLVDAETFALFEASARRSGDLLFQRVCDDAQSFLPGLRHRRVLATSLAREIPMADWRVITERVLGWLLAHQWGRPPVSNQLNHACH